MISELLVIMRKLFKKIYYSIPVTPLYAFLSNTDLIFRKLFSKKEVIVKRKGVWFKLNLDQMIDSSIFFNNYFEPETYYMFKKLIKPGNIIFDIGANVGAHAFYLSRLSGTNGKVYAFEPTEWAFNKFRCNMDLNPGIRNITIERIALSDKNNCDKQYSFRSQWKEGGPAEEESGRVDHQSLDTYCKKHHIEKVDFIKLDVDGYESKIIRGSKKILEKNKPIMIVEMGDYWQRAAGDSIEILVGMLDEVGYEYRTVENLQPIDDIISYVKSFDGKNAVNIVCLPKEEISLRNKKA